jgi:predicted ATPase with chaperone activity
MIASLHYTLTEAGRSRAHELLAQNSYAGAAPVLLEDYIEMVWHQTIHSTVADEPVVKAGFKDLVLRDELFNQLGPAINSGRSLFLYGPPGTGKTSVGKDIAELFQDDIFMPYSILAHGQIVQIFDPISHELSENPPESYDIRWACTKRPVVVVGGELTLDMLELNMLPLSNYYDAPLQLKANNGVLIIDDFGRQRCSVRDLLNRWIIPLETSQEYLALSTGQKLTVPFDVLVIFCTNIAPKELVDEAFLRRIRHKIKLDYVSPEEFIQILKINCTKNYIEYDEEAATYLLEMYYRQPNRPIVAVHARDIVDHIVDYARYRRIEPVLNKETIDIACSTYFVEGY